MSQKPQLLLSKGLKLLQSLGLDVLCSYALWSLFYYFLILSFATYTLAPSLATLDPLHTFWLEHNIELICLSPFLYNQLLHPFRSTHLFSRAFFLFESFNTSQREYFEGWLEGALLAGITLALGVYLGFYHYLGWNHSQDHFTFHYPKLLLRIAAFSLWIYSEEWILRGGKAPHLNTEGNKRMFNQLLAGYYPILKAIQFHHFSFDWSFFFSFYALSYFLSYASQTRSYRYSAGLLTGMLVLFQPIAGCLIFDNLAPGLLTFQEQTGSLHPPILTPLFQALLIGHTFWRAFWSHLWNAQSRSHQV